MSFQFFCISILFYNFEIFLFFKIRADVSEGKSMYSPVKNLSVLQHLLKCCAYRETYSCTLYFSSLLSFKMKMVDNSSVLQVRHAPRFVCMGVQPIVDLSTLMAPSSFLLSMPITNISLEHCRLALESSLKEHLTLVADHDFTVFYFLILHYSGSTVNHVLHPSNDVVSC